MVKLEMLHDHITLPLLLSPVEKDIKLLSCECTQMLDREHVRKALDRATSQPSDQAALFYRQVHE